MERFPSGQEQPLWHPEHLQHLDDPEILGIPEVLVILGRHQHQHFLVRPDDPETLEDPVNQQIQQIPIQLRPDDPEILGIPEVPVSQVHLYQLHPEHPAGPADPVGQAGQIHQ